MYFVIILILFALSAGLIISGLNTKKFTIAAAGAAIGIISIIIFSMLNIWGEFLWFDSAGFASRFWISVRAKIIMGVGGALAGFLFILILNMFHKGNPAIKLIGCIVGAFIGAQWGYINWDRILLFLKQAGTEVVDPVIGKSVSFYLFSLPFFEIVQSFLLTMTVLSLAVMLASRFLNISIQYDDMRVQRIDLQQTFSPGYFRNVFINAGILFLLLSVGSYLQRYKLLYSALGAVHGVGWTDDHILLPAYTLLAGITGLTGVILILSPASTVINKISKRFNTPSIFAPFAYIGGFAAVCAVV